MPIDVSITNNAEKVLREMTARLAQALETVGVQAEANAVTEVNRAVYDTPPSPNYVRTGNLRSSIAHAVDNAEQCAVVGARIEYAPDVELGTSKMKARPFLRPAVANYADQYKAMFDAIMHGNGAGT